MLFRFFTWRHILTIFHDLGATAAALILSIFFRYDPQQLTARWNWLAVILPCFLLVALPVILAFRLQTAKWRFVSLPDLRGIFWVATTLAVALVLADYVLLSPDIFGAYFLGKVAILQFWIFELFFLTGSRIVYRMFRQWRTMQRSPRADCASALLVGRAADAEVVIRAIESGAIKKVFPLGIISPSTADLGQTLRGVPVLGAIADFESAITRLRSEGQSVTRAILTSSGLERDAAPETIIAAARHLHIAVSQMPALGEASREFRLEPIRVEDLLLRPTTPIDFPRLEAFVRGKAVVVTGGGGSIGSEICRRLVSLGALRLLVLEISELALHGILEELQGCQTGTTIEGRIADIRERGRLFRLLKEFKPDLVFHAAALKHVPLLERDWDEAVKTNVLGSVNVADATVAAEVPLMVMISTDKAIDPVSMLGATKRMAEMYCHARDVQMAQEARGGPTTRFVAVRFGNVLASNGSVVPKFKAQIEAGGPITVTHPDMVRYFMTIREACNLVITAASHARESSPEAVSVYVLNMGQPIKIVDLATNMIRLSGLEPGVDIDVVFTGMRPGERLHEILFAENEPNTDIGVGGVLAAKPYCPAMEKMTGWIETLVRHAGDENRAVIDEVLRSAVPGFRGQR